MSVHKVIWGVLPVHIPYEGLERVFAICGYKYSSYYVITKMIELPNNSPFPDITFSVLTKDLDAKKDSLLPPECVLGFCHTHPDNEPEPSLSDIDGIAHGMLGLVVSNSSTHNWYTSKGTINPLILL